MYIYYLCNITLHLSLLLPQIFTLCIFHSQQYQKLEKKLHFMVQIVLSTSPLLLHRRIYFKNILCISYEANAKIFIYLYAQVFNNPNACYKNIKVILFEYF
jgi:hypothetical protein